jgi:phenylalanyl-tRNA synthetase beta chain
VRPTKTKPKLIRSDFMPVERDLAFIVGEDVNAADIVKAAESAERSLVARVGVFDVYRGEGMAEGAKSIAIHVTLQPRERTLTEAEIDAAISRIVAEVSKKTGARLRS